MITKNQSLRDVYIYVSLFKRSHKVKVYLDASLKKISLQNAGNNATVYAEATSRVTLDVFYQLTVVTSMCS